MHSATKCSSVGKQKRRTGEPVPDCLEQRSISRISERSEVILDQEQFLGIWMDHDQLLRSIPKVVCELEKEIIYYLKLVSCSFFASPKKRTKKR